MSGCRKVLRKFLENSKKLFLELCSLRRSLRDLLSTSQLRNELGIQDLLQRFSAIFHEKTEKKWLDEFGPSDKMRAEVRRACWNENSDSFSYGKRQ